MQVYFEDGTLWGIVDIDKPYHRIDATYGVSECINELEWYLENNPDTIIYTNFLQALSFDFSWDMVKNECTAYIRNSNGEWTNIQELTNKELRFAHNIPKMYLAGEFQ